MGNITNWIRIERNKSLLFIGNEKIAGNEIDITFLFEYIYLKIKSYFYHELILLGSIYSIIQY
jgi:hypothetical protein